MWGTRVYSFFLLFSSFIFAFIFCMWKGLAIGKICGTNVSVNDTPSFVGFQLMTTALVVVLTRH